MPTNEAEVPPLVPVDLIAFKWAESLPERTQNALLTSEVRRLQEMIDSGISSALVEVWEKAFTAVRKVGSNIASGEEYNEFHGLMVDVFTALEVARDQALSAASSEGGERC